MPKNQFERRSPNIALAAVFVGVSMVGIGVALLSMEFVTSEIKVANRNSDQRRVDSFNYARDVESGFDADELGHLVKSYFVPHDPIQSANLRKWIVEENGANVKGKSVYEVETGTGYLAFYCASKGAAQVLGADVKKMAFDNACFNNTLMQYNCNFIYIDIDSSNQNYFLNPTVGKQRFDVILSSPVWVDTDKSVESEDSLPRVICKAVLANILKNAGDHLTDNGKLLLAYSSKEAIETIEKYSDGLGWTVQRLDERDLKSLEDEIRPGMTLLLTRKVTLR